MKKSLLLASAAILAFSASAEKDPATYAPVDGYKLVSISMNRNMPDANHAIGTFETLQGVAFPSLNYVRTATVLDGKVYVASSGSGSGEGQMDCSVAIFNAYTGDYEKTIQLTKGGQQYSGLLAANCIGHDDFGHIYVIGYRGTLWVEGADGGHANMITVHLLNTETGELTEAFQVGLEAEDRGYSGRVDNYDIIGDITRKDARCVIMCGIAQGAGNYVAGWYAEQGTDEFLPHFDGQYYTVLELDSESLYPNIDNFNGGTSVTIVPDDEFSGELFYVDDMNCTPALFNAEGSLQENFAGVSNPAEEGAIRVVPKTNPAGCCDFILNGEYFFAYSIEEYESPDCNRANIAKLGANGEFAGMTRLFTIPVDGLGQGDNAKGGPGSRLHRLEAEVVTDANGVDGAYVFTFKAGSGFAYYLFAPEAFNAGIEEATVADANAPVEFFNLQGIRVANPENGIFIRRQGANVTKVVK